MVAIFFCRLVKFKIISNIEYLFVICMVFASTVIATMDHRKHRNMQIWIEPRRLKILVLRRSEWNKLLCKNSSSYTNCYPSSQRQLKDSNIASREYFSKRCLPFWTSSTQALRARDPRTFNLSLTIDGVINL